MLGATLTQGWPGLALAYAAVQAPLLAGLVRGRAEPHKYVLSPLIAAPLTAAVGMSMSTLGPVLTSIGASPRGLAHLALATLVSAAVGYAGGRFMSRGMPQANAYQRGAIVDERHTAVSKKKGSSRSCEAQITLAGHRVPIHDESKHFKLIGTTGTGKSTAIEELLSHALDRGDRAVIADPDAGYLRRFYDPDRGDAILNPFDGRSRKWDLFAEIENSYDIEQLARSLIPDHEGADRSWRAYGRTFVSAVTRQARESGVTDVGELYRLLLVAEAKELRALLRGTSAQPFLDEHNARMFDSIRSVTSSAVSALEYVAQQEGPGFSIRSWAAREQRGVLFMPYKAGQIAALGTTISAWMRLAIFETMNHDSSPPGQANPADKRLWFVIDELDALGPIDGLKDALARLRKFGGRCILGLQSIAQVSSTYGIGEAHTIVENCGNTVILRCSASEGGGTARFASQLIGEREMLRTTVSKTHRLGEMWGSISHGQHLGIEPAILPSQLEQLPDLEGYLKFASDARWRRVRLDAARIIGKHRSEEPHVARAAHRTAERSVRHSESRTNTSELDGGMPNG